MLTVMQRQALQETKNVLPGMKTKIEQAVERLEEELVSFAVMGAVSLGYKG